MTASSHKIWLILGLITLLSSCTATVNTRVTTTRAAAPSNAEVTVLNNSELYLGGCQELGRTRIFDGGFATKCNYERGIENIEEESRKIGANTALITRHRPPALSSCHQFEATLYHCPASAELMEAEMAAKVAAADSLMDQNVKKVEEFQEVEEGVSSQEKGEEGEVTDEEISYFPAEEERAEYANEETSIVEPKQKLPITYPNIRIEAHTGLSRTRGQLADGLDPVLVEHFTELRTGQHFGGSILVRITDGVYLGPSFSQFSSFHDSGTFIVTLPDSTTEVTGLSNKVTNTFFGLTLGSMSLSENGQWEFLSTVSLGANVHLNDEVALGQRRYSATSFALDVGMEAGYLMTENLSIGLGIGMYTSSFSKVEIVENGLTETLGLDQAETAARWDLSLGLRWYPGRLKKMAREISPVGK